MTAVITARLTLAIRLVDTTTGREVPESDNSFYIDGGLVHPMRKGPGTYVLVNMSREDFLMRICVRGFMDEDVNVRFDELDQRLPIIDVFLMPSEKNQIGGRTIQINGTLSGLEYLQAINLNQPVAAYQSIVARKEIKMTVLPITNGGGVALEEMAYAILSKDQMRYEVFNVQQQDAPTSVVIRDRLKFQHELNDRIFRIIYGRAGPRGDFILKIRDDAKVLNYLLYLKVDGEEYLRPIDFHLESGVIDPLEGATKISVLEETEGKEGKEES